MNSTFSSYGSLKKPPTHPSDATSRMEEKRLGAVEQCVATMPEQDQDFMYEQRKNHLHQERVLSSFLKLIRKYEFLPKRLLLEGFQDAIKHIYTLQEEAIKEEKRQAKEARELTQLQRIAEETQQLKEAEAQE